jgi:putative aldouronate transport system permease protein
MPICKPILAAVIVFTAISQWNQWYDNLLLVNNNNLKTLQLTLLEYLRKSMNAANEARSGGAVSDVAISPISIRMTMTMVATLPILIVYPMMQKYFVKGIMVGAIKG